MDTLIQEILEDLYTIEPTWRAKEEELMKIIEKLVTFRPEAQLDESFKAELKAQLLQELKMRKGKRRIGSPGRIIAVTSAAAAVVLVVFTMSLFQFQRSKQARLAMDNNYASALAPVPLSPSKPLARSETLAKTDTVDKGRVAASELEKRRVTSQEATLIGGAGLAETTRGNSGEEALVPSLDQPFGFADIPIDEIDVNTEEYTRIYENEFLDVIGNPLSTFSIDVDTASYANVRRFLHDSQLPYPDAVRIEELINYFSYDYPQPVGEEPFSFTTEIGSCPWNSEHQLLHVGLQGKMLEAAELPPANLVFLLDSSGSMDSLLKLPLLKQGFGLLVENLRAEDRVAIVTYAGSAGLVLPSTPGSDKQRILAALEELDAGGSTAGGAGIELAYKVAVDNFRQGGNNRIILATDGDFNVGPSSEGELVRLIEKKRAQGIFLTVLGFGSGNYKDTRMEQLADKGNGNYGYIDSLLEAKKILVSEFGATMYTIAKDVKLQLEFNPARVKAYRLIGYENRLLAAEDFEDDTKDAGELGAGHTVTALYELIPADGQSSGQEFKYQQTTVKEGAAGSPEWLTLKFRYKRPQEDVSRLIEVAVSGAPLSAAATSDNFRFSAAVAEWGLLLRDSRFKGSSSFTQVLDLARGSLGYDANGYREEFVSLVKSSAVLKELQN